MELVTKKKRKPDKSIFQVLVRTGNLNAGFQFKHFYVPFQEFSYFMSSIINPAFVQAKFIKKVAPAVSQTCSCRLEAAPAGLPNPAETQVRICQSEPSDENRAMRTERWDRAVSELANDELIANLADILFILFDRAVNYCQIYDLDSEKLKVERK